MQSKNFKYPDTKAFEFVIQRLGEKGIFTKDIAQITYDLQADKIDDLNVVLLEQQVIEVLHKREVLNSMMVGLELDRLAQEKQLAEPLQEIVANDAGVFGVDEIIAIAIANIYGTIGVTNFGYVDRVKTGIIKQLDTSEEHVNTFIDDLVGALAAAVAAKTAHAIA
ncbi:phosphatidylglycerophosphatase A [Secundilactobacillus kimchicus]|uniref:phosphatidylglycerophosphatase A family protein n=1 Tax=Secundilactobacillus kimchicus TaxID=528209 RepID=UPI001C01BE18|nr:phosphatidylglycerophosphatase A [Secundilactobacillus kimchicus]MBT9670605.1 phosphatidylglycerophosphatase A [Secundilactobacillus kimchicus]